MASNNALVLTSLDFDTLKQQFISWLESNSVFKDYKFNSSTTNVLLDVMSYNTYMNSFYLNMTLSEMFIDSAQKMDSVVSHAKELNYLPRSAVSSQARISFTIDTIGITSPFIVPKGTTFRGRNSNGTYVFTTNQSLSFVSNTTTFAVPNLDVYEGTFKRDAFVVNYSSFANDSPLTYLLTNQNVDLGSLSVTVSQDNGSNVVVWTYAGSLFGLTPNSTIFFVQAAENLQYELIFDRSGLFSETLQHGARLIVDYRTASGSAADGVTSFTCTTDLGSFNGGTGNVSPIVTVSNSSIGQAQESIESVRFTAPRFFAAQERAVSTNDYASLVLEKFGGTISDVTAYGGNELIPRQYGIVAVCLKPTTGTIAADTVKNDIVAYLSNKIVVPGRVVITDPVYLYCSIKSTVSYNPTQTTLSAGTLSGRVLDSIMNYSNTELGTFSSSFYYTPFCHTIDETDTSILSNATTVYMISRFVPILNVAWSTTINFNNPTLRIATSAQETRNQVIPLTRLSDEPVVWSSQFTYVAANGSSYPASVMRDDNFGNMIVMTTINNKVSVLNDNIGTIQYSTGLLTISGLVTSGYGSYVSMYMQTDSPDFTVQNEQIMLIDPNDVSITMKSITVPR